MSRSSTGKLFSSNMSQFLIALMQIKDVILLFPCSLFSLEQLIYDSPKEERHKKEKIFDLAPLGYRSK